MAHKRKYKKIQKTRDLKSGEERECGGDAGEIKRRSSKVCLPSRPPSHHAAAGVTGRAGARPGSPDTRVEAWKNKGINLERGHAGLHLKQQAAAAPAAAAEARGSGVT